MEKGWDAMNPPKNEEELIGQWFVCIFKSTKAPNLYIRKTRKRFPTAEANEQGYIEAVKIDCLQLKLGVTDYIFRECKAPLKDIDVIPIKDVFMGPLKEKKYYCKNVKWKFPQYLNVKKVFEKIKNVERDVIYNTYVCKKCQQD